MAEAQDKSRSIILVVDDKEAVLTIVQSILKEEGFRVLIAKDGVSAVKLASEVPGMTGPQLGADIKDSRPDMPGMLRSGLPDGDRLVLNHVWAFIQKPFIAATLVGMVSAVLQTPNGSRSKYAYETPEIA
jgi:DNA-binding NtrC family response regulator